jgi:hypothetical protein
MAEGKYDKVEIANRIFTEYIASFWQQPRQTTPHHFDGSIGTTAAPLNAFRPIRRNCDPFSNVSDSSREQLRKHSSPMVLTDDGITIACSPLPQNADLSI